MEKAGISATTSAQMHRAIVEMGRVQYQVAAYPMPEVISDAMKTVANDKSIFEHGMQTLMASADSQQLSIVRPAEEDYSTYVDDLNRVLADVQARSAEFKMTAENQKILGEIESTDEMGRELDDMLSNFSDYSTEKEQNVAVQAHASFTKISYTLVVLAVTGIAISLVIGWWVSSRGIVRPLNSSVGSLRKLAEGDLEAEVYGVQRKDEVGDIAQTMQVFKDTAIRSQQLAAGAGKDA